LISLLYKKFHAEQEKYFSPFPRVRISALKFRLHQEISDYFPMAIRHRQYKTVKFALTESPHNIAVSFARVKFHPGFKIREQNDGF